jgi:S-adenosylmethionine synthetase
MKNNYIVTEKDSNIVFAVISDANHDIGIMNKVCQAVEDEFCYEPFSVKIVHHTGKKYDDGSQYVEVKGVCDDMEEEIRQISITPITIY